MRWNLYIITTYIFNILSSIPTCYPVSNNLPPFVPFVGGIVGEVGEVGALANFPDRHFVCYDPAFYTFLFATSGPCLYLFIFILDSAFLFSNSGHSWCSWSSLSIKSQFICFLVFLYDQTLSLYCNLQVLLCLCFRMRYTPVVNLCCPQKILSVL